MFQFLTHSLFSIAIAASSFYAGVKLTERHYREKEATVANALIDERAFRDTHYVSRIEQPRFPRVGTPATPPAAHSRTDAALAPGGPVETRLNENGQATYMFSGKHAPH